jgi:aldose 1-epimerase
LRIEYLLDGAGLQVTTTAENLGRTALPVGLGFHPYVTVGLERMDSALLTVPADNVVETDDRGIPTGTTTDVAGTSKDFRVPRPIGDQALDHCFGGLQADGDGRVRVTLAHPDGSRAVVVWMEPELGYLMVFTGDTLGADERRRAVAVEPMTCPPNAFRTGDGLTVLEPGARLAWRWGIEPA